jgi:hypothetical protein
MGASKTWHHWSPTWPTRWESANRPARRKREIHQSRRASP